MENPSRGLRPHVVRERLKRTCNLMIRRIELGIKPEKLKCVIRWWRNEPLRLAEAFAQEFDEALRLRRQQAGFGEGVDGDRGALPLR
jgi:hypothetical protein